MRPLQEQRLRKWLEANLGHGRSMGISPNRVWGLGFRHPVFTPNRRGTPKKDTHIFGKPHMSLFALGGLRFEKGTRVAHP